MAEPAPGTIGIQLAGETETVWGAIGPEDRHRLAALLRGGTVTISLGDEGDLTGHAQTSDLTLDVDGHALTLRMSSVAQSAALRRRLAVGALTATIVAGGAIAASSALHTPTAQQTLPGAPIAPVVQPAQGVTHRTVSDPYMIDLAPPAAQPAVPAPPAAPVARPARDVTHRTVNDPYMIDSAQPAAPAAPAVAPAASEQTAPSRDDHTFPRPGQRPAPR